MSDYFVEVFKKNNRFEEYKDKVINRKVTQVKIPYFYFDEPLRRRYWKMARENLLNFNEDFDVEILDSYVKFFYIKALTLWFFLTVHDSMTRGRFFCTTIFHNI